MLKLAFAFLSVACAFGAFLAMLVMRADEKAGRPPWRVAAVHGVLGGVGVAILLWGLWGAAPRGVAEGVGPFGWDAAGLLSAALLAGIAVLVLRRRSGLLLALHAVLAMFGYVILAAYVSLG